MKAQVIKNINSYSSAILLFSVSYILFIGILIFLSGFVQTNRQDNLLITQSTEIQDSNNPNDNKLFIPLSLKSDDHSKQCLSLKSMNDINFENKFKQDLEKEKLLIRISMTEEKMNFENGADGSLEFEREEANMNDYLIVEDEPELQVNTAISINFPSHEPIQLAMNQSHTQSNDIIKQLQNLVEKTTKEAIEHFEYQLQLKEYLTIEMEKPMELEKWMTDEKCWCRDDLQEVMAINLTNKTTAIKR